MSLYLLEIARNGWHGKGLDKGGNKFSISFYTNNLNNCLQRANEGTIVIDKSGVEDEILVPMVIKGPMVDVSLPEKTIDRFGHKKVLSQILPHTTDDRIRLIGLVALTERRNDAQLGSLDNVSLDIWTDLWREAGARIGTVADGHVEWEN